MYATFILSTLFGATALMEGKTPDQAAAKVADTIGPTMKVNWMIW